MTLLKYPKIPKNPDYAEAVAFLQSIRQPEWEEILADDDDSDMMKLLLNTCLMVVMNTWFMAASGGEEQQQAAAQVTRNVLQVLFGAGYREGVWDERTKRKGA